MPTVLPFVPLASLLGEVAYEYGPDSTPRPNVHAGRLDEIRFDDSVRFPGTSRKVWIHRPAGVSPSEVKAIMFFNDGWWYLDPEGDVRAGTVLDNLAAAREIPPMVGVFVDPGVRDVENQPTKNRNVEYDAFDDRYASFLVEEVLPVIEEHFGISTDPAMRGICGGSSGGNAAFTAGWCRSEALGRVIAFNSSFAQMPAGNPYPALLRSGRHRGIRVFLHAAHRDLGWNEPHDNWFAENLEVAAALARAGYDFRLVVGDGGHSPNHGGALLPDALRWLWSDTVH